MAKPSKTASTTKGYSRPFVKRLGQLFQRIKGARPVTATQLAEDFGVVRRTVMRDIAYLRDELGIGIQFDAARKSYRCTTPVRDLPAALRELPLVKPDADFLAGLILVWSTLRALKNQGASDQLDHFVRHFSRMLEEGSGADRARLNSLFSSQIHLPNQQEVRCFRTLSTALIEGREVRFRYKNLMDDEARERTFRPYHMTQVDGFWYAIGLDVSCGEVRTFALPRMSFAKLTRETYEIPAAFRAEEYAQTRSNQFGIWDGNAMDVKVRLSGWAARLVQERHHHPQRGQEVKDLVGSPNVVEFSFKAGGLNDVVRWVLSWAGFCQVIEPPELKRAVKDAIQLMARRMKLG